MTQPAPSVRDVLVLTQIVDLVRAGGASTRPEIEAATGLGRTIVNQRVREGLELGVLAEEEAAPSGLRRGRPSRSLRFRTEAGLVLTACLGEVSLDAAVSTLDGRALATDSRSIDIARGPVAVLRTVDRVFRSLLGKVDTSSALWAITIGVPGPVDSASGRVVVPPVLPGWSDFDVRTWFFQRYGVPVWLENEVNLMALGEWERGIPQERRDLLYVKVATGIGSGMVADGRLRRGDTGAAGDIGHVRVTDRASVSCRCGRRGCLETLASGWALSRNLTEKARAGASPLLEKLLAAKEQLTGHDVGMAVKAGDQTACHAVRAAARITGTMVAGVVNFANPGTLVLGGGVIRYGGLFFDEFEKAVRKHAIDTAAYRLTIRPASLDFSEGVTGGALLAARNLLHPTALRRWLGDGTPIRAAELLHAG